MEQAGDDLLTADKTLELKHFFIRTDEPGRIRDWLRILTVVRAKPANCLRASPVEKPGGSTDEPSHTPHACGDRDRRLDRFVER
jgi:hypothetical protein